MQRDRLAGRRVERDVACDDALQRGARQGLERFVEHIEHLLLADDPKPGPQLVEIDRSGLVGGRTHESTIANTLTPVRRWLRRQGSEGDVFQGRWSGAFVRVVVDVRLQRGCHRVWCGERHHADCEIAADVNVQAGALEAPRAIGGGRKLGAARCGGRGDFLDGSAKLVRRGNLRPGGAGSCAVSNDAAEQLVRLGE